jgi:hypothetical protein
LELSALQDCEAFSDHSHVAFIEVSKRRRRGLAADSAMNQFAGVSTFLDCDLGYAG